MHNKGFTLAEVLITLAIIGVVAAMTVPSIIQGQQEKATVAAVKKIYSTLSNAYKLAEQENGSPDTWGITAGVSPPSLSMLKPYLNVAKDCIDGSSGCFPPGVDYKYLKPTGSDGVYDNLSGPKLKLADGTLIMSNSDSPSCGLSVGDSLALQNACVEYYVDINGYKGPNQWGKDVFWFWLTKYGIVPNGTAQQTDWRNFSNQCKNNYSTYGYGCAAWVIYNENLDYLHCNDLDWTTKTKCN